MTPTPIETVRGAYDAFAVGDVGAVLKTLSPEVVWVESTAKGLPVQGDLVGPDQVMAKVFATVPDNWSEFHVVPDELFSDGTTVVARGRVKAVAKATGRALDAPFVHVFTFEDGKVVRMTNHHDTALWLEALKP